MRHELTWEMQASGRSTAAVAYERGVMALVLALPVPLFAAVGLSLPLPNVVYKLGLAAVERTAAIADALPTLDRDAREPEQTSVAARAAHPRAAQPAHRTPAPAVAGHAAPVGAKTKPTAKREHRARVAPAPRTVSRAAVTRSSFAGEGVTSRARHAQVDADTELVQATAASTPAAVAPEAAAAPAAVAAASTPEPTRATTPAATTSAPVVTTTPAAATTTPAPTVSPPAATPTTPTPAATAPVDPRAAREAERAAQQAAKDAKAAQDAADKAAKAAAEQARKDAEAARKAAAGSNSGPGSNSGHGSNSGPGSGSTTTVPTTN
jgi:hypothetical protein